MRVRAISLVLLCRFWRRPCFAKKKRRKILVASPSPARLFVDWRRFFDLVHLCLEIAHDRVDVRLELLLVGQLDLVGARRGGSRDWDDGMIHDLSQPPIPFSGADFAFISCSRGGDAAVVVCFQSVASASSFPFLANSKEDCDENENSEEWVDAKKQCARLVAAHVTLEATPCATV